MADAATQRLVPGAPPPASLSKSAAKKKRKAGAGGTGSAKPPASPSSTPAAIPDATSAALVEKAPDVEDIKQGALASELVADPEPSRGATPAPAAGTPAPAGEPKRSPVYELVNKRQKILGKKIMRFQSYAVQDQAKLNDDQLRSLKTLPTLEAVSKELEDVKKAIHDHDIEQVGAVDVDKAEREAVEAQKVADAVAANTAGHISRTLDLLTLVRIHNLLANGHPQAVALGLNEPESSAIFGIVEALVGDGADRQSIVHGFLNSEGGFNGISYLRVQEIVNTFMNSPPTVNEPTNGVNGETSHLAADPAVVISRAPSAGPTTTSFHFINASELDDDQAVAQDVPEVVQTGIAVAEEEEEEAPVTVTEVITVTEVAPGVEVVEDTVVIETEPQPIDWADPEHDDLPPLDNLQASFGVGATPAADSAALPTESAEPLTLGVDADGFSAARGRGYRGQRRGGPEGGRGGDGRGRGLRGGYRGGRGGFRGDRGGDRGGHDGSGFRSDRGSHEGGGFRSDHLPGGEGERGGYRGRGRGGYRGNDGGERGGGYYRGGGDRGAPRGGRSEGDWRSSGDGRGRGGRSRGRGGFQEGQSSTPPTPQAA